MTGTLGGRIRMSFFRESTKQNKTLLTPGPPVPETMVQEFTTHTQEEEENKCEGNERNVYMVACAHLSPTWLSPCLRPPCLPASWLVPTFAYNDLSSRHSQIPGLSFLPGPLFVKGILTEPRREREVSLLCFHTNACDY
ncbi:uncharacterized protein LOC105306030 isoform X2 [Pteropus vampyrus]|uniref:Uncharacterized protein LOC105306030 isoform X2 n=1 Tax=Pteropus vampyrus TaxID=132908 RepID=A0A6P6BXE4_PTEVA|nr:uncharacterized protein LOC105306030 isoform X2 [Pteropus vampyrus]